MSYVMLTGTPNGYYVRGTDATDGVVIRHDRGFAQSEAIRMANGRDIVTSREVWDTVADRWVTVMTDWDGNAIEA
jgi:hypothetical protein